MKESVDERLKRLAADLRAGLGENLISVLLYGSAARGDHASATSDLNVMAVVKDSAPALLTPAAPCVRAWMAEGHRAPLFVTPSWIRGSADVFPMEFLDMLDARRVIHGGEPLSEVTVTAANLRLECEREIRTLLLRLRGAWLEAHDDAGRLLGLISGSWGSAAAIARAALRLAGERVPARSEDLFDAAARRFGLGASAFADAAAVKRSGRAEPLPRMREIFLGYFEQMEALSRALDEMRPGGSGGPGPR